MDWKQIAVIIVSAIIAGILTPLIMPLLKKAGIVKEGKAENN